MKCQSPVLVYNKYLGHKVLVPCGKCDCCRIQKSNLMAYRVKNECNKHAFNVFFTLHYSNDYIPVIKDGSKFLYLRRRNDTAFMLSSVFTPDDVELVPLENHMDFSNVPNNVTSYSCKFDRDGVSNGNFRGVLYYPDVQSLLKRLRVAFAYDLKTNKLIYHDEETKDFVTENSKFRYVLCGEYGGKYNRPHYHGIFHTHSKTVAEWFISNLPKFWIFEDWSIARRKNERGVDGMPSYTSAESAANYVSKYVAGVVSGFDNCIANLFPPIIKTSKVPYYGLCQADEDLEKKITMGNVGDTYKHLEKKSDGFVFVEPSKLLKDRLLKRFYGIDKLSLEELSRLICFHRDIDPTSKGSFLKWIRKRLLFAFGNLHYTTVLGYLQRVQKFFLYLFTRQLEDTYIEVNYNLCEHAKRAYNTLADYYPKNDNFLMDNIRCLFDQNKIESLKVNEIYEKIGKSFHSLVSVLRNYDFTDIDLLRILYDRTLSVFAPLVTAYRQQYIKNLLPKHFNPSVNLYG